MESAELDILRSLWLYLTEFLLTCRDKMDLFAQIAETKRWTILSIQKNPVKILQKLPIIGNLIESVIITPQVIRTINQIFLTHLHENFHKPFHLKSLSALI